MSRLCGNRRCGTGWLGDRLHGDRSNETSNRADMMNVKACFDSFRRVGLLLGLIIAYFCGKRNAVQAGFWDLAVKTPIFVFLPPEDRS